jgi:hypothetical protein
MEIFPSWRNKMLSPEEKASFAQRLSNLRLTVEKMQTHLDKEEWKHLCDLHVEMDDQADALYEDITHLLVEMAYSLGAQQC